MGKLKIQFRKEVEVDLNNYYGSFKPALRRAIDDAIYDLLGGQSKPKSNGHAIASSKGAKSAILKRTAKQPIKTNSKLAAFLAKLPPSKDELYVWQDLEDLCEQHKLDKNCAIHNMVQSGYFTLTQ